MQRAYLVVGSIILAAVLIAVVGVYVLGTNNNSISQESDGEESVVILKTTKGDITLELFRDRTPTTSQNFIELAKIGFYDGVKFHRVLEGFVIQAGDPNTKGDDVSSYGRGGPGYTISDEFVEELSNARGTVAMANTGVPNSGGSQFFINLTDNTGLDFDKEPRTSRHPVFGRVTGGMDVVDAIARVPTNEDGLPLDPVVIERVIIN